MPRRPNFADHEQDRRFDRYRDRVGRLFRGAKEVGLVLVVAEPYAEVVKGHLWWRRWTRTRDILWTWFVLDGRQSDSVLTDDKAISDELNDYDDGRLNYCGETLRVVWTDPDESARLREMQFER